MALINFHRNASVDRLNNQSIVKHCDYVVPQILQQVAVENNITQTARTQIRVHCLVEGKQEQIIILMMLKYSHCYFFSERLK